MTRRRDPFAERAARRPESAAIERVDEDSVPLEDLRGAVLAVASGGAAQDMAAGRLAVALAGDRPVLGIGAIPGATHNLNCDADLLGALVDLLDPAHVVLPEDGAHLSDLGRRTGVARGWPVATRVVALGGTDALCATNLTDAEARVHAPRLWLVDPRFAGAAVPDRVPVPVDAPALSERPPPGATFLDIEEPDAGRLALPDARFVVAAGAGVSDLDLFARFADALGATPGASRVLVDAGRMPRHRQVGASGETTEAEIYLALGISGAIQHLEGIAGCRTVISVNIDPGCPMAARSDLALVGDAGAVMRAVLARLEAKR